MNERQATSGVSTTLTYEQEVHAVLCHAAAASEDLIRYFEAQASQEKGDAKRLTLKCIENEKHSLQRVRDLIPLALERREAALSPAGTGQPDALLQRISDYRSGYSAGYNSAQNGLPMRDKDAASRFFNADVSEYQLNQGGDSVKGEGETA